MFQIAEKPLVEWPTQHKFSLFSSKEEEFTDRCMVDCLRTTGDPTYAPFVGSVSDNSPYIVMIMMFYQLLSTPKQNTKLVVQVQSGSLPVEECKNLEVHSKQQSVSMWNSNLTNSCHSDADKKACSSSFLLPSAVSADSDNTIYCKEMSFIPSPRQTDISWAISGKSGLSISLSPGISISPSDEFCDGEQSNISGNKEAPIGKKKALELENGKRYWPSINRFRNRGAGMEFSNRKSRGKRRRNYVQRERKQAISTDHIQKNSCSEKHLRLSTACTQKGKNMNIIANGNLRKNLARLISSEKLTPGETLKKLMNNGNMFFALVTNQEGSRYFQETLISLTTEQL